MSDFVMAYLTYYGLAIIALGVAALGLSLVAYNIWAPRDWLSVARVRLLAFNALVLSGVFGAFLVLVRRQM